MPRSMTGFARLEAEHSWGTLIWELRSVNHRYLEPHFRLPDSMRSLETALREQIRKKAHRGKIEVSLNIQRQITPDSDLGINHDLVQQIANAAHQINDLLTDAAPVNALDILRWPGVIQEEELDLETATTTTLEAFNRSLEQLMENREREGTKLGQFIEQRLETIHDHVIKVRKLLPDILTAMNKKLISRLDAIKVEVDQDRLEQEMVYLLNKADVDEELDRIDAHIAEVRHTLKQKNAIGRRLDFLMQELNREANTLSSKSVVTETTQVAVDIKVLIEQMREQVQNIE